MSLVFLFLEHPVLSILYSVSFFSISISLSLSLSLSALLLFGEWFCSFFSLSLPSSSRLGAAAAIKV